MSRYRSMEHHHHPVLRLIPTLALTLVSLSGCGVGLKGMEALAQKDATVPPLLVNASTLTALTNTSIIPRQIANLGSSIHSCTAAPALPPGLNISPTCMIWGTPTATSSLNVYMITGTNPYGSSSAIIPLVVQDGPPDLVDANLINGFTSQALSSVDFENDGGAATSCTSVPTLPSGLSLSVFTGTCRISGTPTTNSADTPYAVTATNVSGSSTASVHIKVSNAVPCMVDAAATTVALRALDFLVSIGNNCGGLTACAVTPALPAGLTLSQTGGACIVTGIPSVLSALQIYTITGTNPAGSDTADLPLEILNVPPVIGSATGIVAPILTAISPSLFPNTGGDVTSCAIAPALPGGLSLTVTGGTCRVSGTPTATSSSATYTVTGTNAMGSSTGTIPIVIGNIAPALQSGGALVTNILSAISPISLTNTGGAVTSCSTTPALPAGLVVGVVSDTCRISGIPSIATAVNSYLVTGTNAEGSSSNVVSLTLNEVAPIIADVTNTSLPILSTITPIVFPNTGGAATSCSVSPALPLGLSASLLNGSCTITGIASIVSSLASYTVTATNAAGSDTAVVGLTFLDVLPDLANASAVSTRAIFGSVSVSFTNSGGSVVTCGVTPALPTGLLLAPLLGTCRITGVPLAQTSATVYTVTGTNLKGSDTATVTITTTP